MRWLAIAQRCRPGADVYARSSDDTWRFEGGMTSDTSDYPACSPDTSFIKANILIDSDGRARLADFGLLTIVSDSTNPTTTNSSNSGGSTRWMSPELIDPEKFGLKDKRRTKESDYYAFAMVILEVLTNQVPFPRYEGFVVPGKVVKGDRPERPQGPEAAWFTDDLWEMLERCWSPDMKLRPAVEAVLGRLESSSTAWRPLPPSADDDLRMDDVCDSFSVISHLSRTSLNLYLNLYLQNPQQIKRSRKKATNPRLRCEIPLINNSPSLVASHQILLVRPISCDHAQAKRQIRQSLQVPPRRNARPLHP